MIMEITERCVKNITNNETEMIEQELESLPESIEIYDLKN